jgi:alanyl-tRNA synthetase
MTIFLFIENSYCFEASAKIIHHDVDGIGSYLILDRTIFYPQGGGQPSDTGIVKCHDFSINVISVRKDGEEIKHYFAEQLPENLNGEQCMCVLDRATRILHARYHSAGHLLSNITEVLYPELTATKAHCFPNEAYVEFHGASVCEQEGITGLMKTTIEAALPITVFEMYWEDFERKFYKLPYPPSHENFRVVQIGNYKPIPCGGTHLASTAEIGNFEIMKIKNKNGNLRISFAVS